MPPTVAHEIRYVVAPKIERGDWTTNTKVLAWLGALAPSVLATGVRSLLDWRPESWALLITQRIRHGMAARDAKSYARTFFVTLHRVLVFRPTQDWLRVSTKNWARECSSTGSRS